MSLRMVVSTLRRSSGSPARNSSTVFASLRAIHIEYRLRGPAQSAVAIHQYKEELMRVRRTSMLVALLILAASTVTAQDLASFEKHIQTRVLDNGLTVIILERHDAPVFSYATLVNTGSAQEVPGITGLAHMFEHMAFKGSDLIGTKDWKAEEAALRRVEDAYAAYLQARDAVKPDAAKVATLEKAWKDAIAEADKYVEDNAFS